VKKKTQDSQIILLLLIKPILYQNMFHKKNYLEK